MEPRTVLGVLTGVVVSLSVALVIAVASNAKHIPGVMPMESAAGGASAPLEPAGKNSAFDGLDIDGDGKLSLAEAAGYAEVISRFQRVDRNKDGKLTKAEFDRIAKLPPPKARPKAKPRLREDAAASLAAARREGQ